MNVLSLFDGIGCARIALDKAKIPVKKYYSSEIDKHAIKVCKTNYPDIECLGDVKAHKWDEMKHGSSLWKKEEIVLICKDVIDKVFSSINLLRN